MRSIARYFIDNLAVTSFLVFILVAGGVLSFFSLGQLEDPVFSIKTAVITTRYPGASPEEVELEVTDRIEQAIQDMPQLKNISSVSKAGESYIKVDIKDRYWSPFLPQIWDELRKKIGDIKHQFPPGVQDPYIGDDFGFVYGFVLAVTGDGYSYRELETYTDGLKKELSLVKGVSRVGTTGVQQPTIYLDVSEKQLASLGLTRETVVKTLQNQNMVVDAGFFETEGKRIRISPSGEFKSPEEISSLTIKPMAIDVISRMASEERKGSKQQYGTDSSLIRVEDIAQVRQGYADPPVMMVRYNGQPAYVLQIAALDDENVVEVGKRLNRRIQEIMPQLPVGIEIHRVAWQSDIVDESVQNFLISLGQALAIVLIVLVIPSGLKMGTIIGIDLLITILGTFIFMNIMEIPLQRMSLGALIIALGMMVDNAIVISDGIAVKIRQGLDRKKAAIDAAVSSAYPLFSATVVAVMAFYPIYGNTASAGEYCQTLFTVVAAALILSWVLAMIITPLQCIRSLPEPEQNKGNGGEFDSPFFQRFRKVLSRLIHYRFATIGVMTGLLALSLFGFQFVSKMFFPDSSRPQLMVDYWAPYGTSIDQTAEHVSALEKMFLESGLTDDVVSFIGAGPPRFYLPVDSERPQPFYAQLIVNFSDFNDIEPFIKEFEPKSSSLFPEAMIRFRKYGVGPGDAWKFEMRVSGPAIASMEELRRIGNEALNIVDNSPYGEDFRLDILNRVPLLVPEYDQKRGRWSGVTRNDLAQSMKRNFDGLQMGIYRELDKLLPIVVRNVPEERDAFLERIDLMQVRPELSTNTVPASQVVDGVNSKWEDPLIARWNRRRSVSVQGNPKEGATYQTLEKSVKEELEAMPLPDGYEIYWDGEAESSRTSQEALIPGLIPAAIIIFLMILTVFNAYRSLLIILMTIPFAFIGITTGLLVFDTPFGFLALLGAMSLAGMMNKNIVVLLDACRDNIEEGMDPYHAIIEASVTRVRPVLLAAGTTVLGVAPLLPDVFWTAMAVTIMAGLSFGSILTLIIVPVFYAILYRVEEPKEKQP